MAKFIITFQVTIDGNKTETGTIGLSSPTTDYYPNRVKDTVVEQYRKKYPDAKNVAVKIISPQQVTNEQYLQSATNFIEIKA
jgi:hypothetical protein